MKLNLRRLENASRSQARWAAHNKEFKPHTVARQVHSVVRLLDAYVESSEIVVAITNKPTMVGKGEQP